MLFTVRGKKQIVKVPLISHYELEDFVETMIGNKIPTLF